MTSRIPAAVMLATVLVLSGVSLLWHVYSDAPAPTKEQWQRVGDMLASRLQPHDVIRFRPVWLAQSETLLTALEGAPIPFVDRTRNPSVMLGTRYSRLWVISTLGYAFETAPAGASEVDRMEFGGDIRVRLYQLDESRLKYPLVDRLDDAEVRRRRSPSGRYAKCLRKGEKHDCRGHAWENVAPDWYEVGGAPRYCFVLHPYPDHGSVKIRWPRVPLESTLLIRSGFTLEAARNENGGDCKVVVTINGDLVDEWIEPKNDWHFDEHHIDTSRWKGGEGALEITVTAADEDFRDLCFDGAVLTTTD